MTLESKSHFECEMTDSTLEMKFRMMDLPPGFTQIIRENVEEITEEIYRTIFRLAGYQMTNQRFDSINEIFYDEKNLN